MRPTHQPRARRPGATDARRASPGGCVRPGARKILKKPMENQLPAIGVYRFIATKVIAKWWLPWRAQWASTPSGLRARGGLCGWRCRLGVNNVIASGLCGNRELASARRHSHPLRQRAGDDGAGESGPLFSLAYPIFSQACRVAVATGRSLFAVARAYVCGGGVDAGVAMCPPHQPRARRPGATDARRAGPGGRVRLGALQASDKYTENRPLALVVYGFVAI
jgi:hypothetical protein